ncbi:calcium-binding protein [Aerosakkonemataceae cyanobacterium BLCC-F154]|uniref:Calcium-binding protein n=1 Tax=Floridaenema fluviatile BLCC-F154 TaxID=3153640 RepID=A0ABV4YN28_9CYAN
MPASEFGYYFLTPGDDYLQITSGLLTNLPIGLVALEGNDFVLGSIDAEIINGNQGQDSIQGGGGNDLVLGGKDRDQISGDFGNDEVNGNIGEDIVFGGAGDDIVRGGKDADLVSGEDGNDLVIGDLGTDVLAGGSGADLFGLRTDIVLADPNNFDIILDFKGSEDFIGVTGGFTEADFFLQPLDVPLNLITTIPGVANIPGISAATIRSTLFDLTGVDVDPNGDGIVNGTSIQFSNGVTLAYVVNSTPLDISGNIIPVGDL